LIHPGDDGMHTPYSKILLLYEGAFARMQIGNQKRFLIMFFSGFLVVVVV